MERLTKHWGEHYVATELDYWSLRDIPKEDFLHLQDIVKKLATYEDLEEQGLLLRLPCRVGDPIYIIESKCLAGQTPEDFDCDDIPCDDCRYDKELIVVERKATLNHLCGLLAGDHDIWAMGKTVFLTREEAEKELAEMGQSKV